MNRGFKNISELYLEMCAADLAKRENTAGFAEATRLEMRPGFVVDMSIRFNMGRSRSRLRSSWQSTKQSSDDKKSAVRIMLNIAAILVDRYTRHAAMMAEHSEGFQITWLETSSPPPVTKFRCREVSPTSTPTPTSLSSQVLGILTV